MKIAQLVLLRATGWTVPSRSKIFLFFMASRSVLRPVLYPLGTGALSPRVKRPGRESYLSSRFNVGVIPPLTHNSLWRGA
jgi:hypothetical protein